MKKDINSIASRRWMLEGVKKDLVAQIGDTAGLQYYYYYTNLDTSNKRDSAEQSNKYYYLNGLDSARKKLVDSLNKIYYQILLAKNDLAIYYNHAYHEKKNISIREFTIWALGIIAFITFILAMISWSRLQKKADDRPDNKGPTYNIEVADNKELLSKINALVSQVQALSNTIQNENKTG